MIRKHKKTLILTSIIVLLPMLFGLVMWNSLPARMPLHMSTSGDVDGWGSKAMGVFLVPAILLGAHWLCIFGTVLDKYNVKQNTKALGIVYWIMPIVSLMTNAMVYAAAFGRSMDLVMILPLLMGVLFIIVGNYMPKCRLNGTLGIKIHWTLANEENWNKTHRVGGRVWVAGGFVMLFTPLMPVKLAWVVIPVIFLIMILVPSLCSYCNYKQQVREGRWQVNGIQLSPKAARIAAIIGVVILAAVVTLLFVGDIEYTFDGETLTIETPFWSDCTVDCEDITAVTYCENGVDGHRTYGFGSMRLLLGNFHNDELGDYTRYTYTGGKPAIIIHTGDQPLVIGADNAADTLALYDQLNNCITDD